MLTHEIPAILVKLLGSTSLLKTSQMCIIAYCSFQHLAARDSVAQRHSVQTVVIKGGIMVRVERCCKAACSQGQGAADQQQGEHLRLSGWAEL